MEKPNVRRVDVDTTQTEEIYVMPYRSHGFEVHGIALEQTISMSTKVADGDDPVYRRTYVKMLVHPLTRKGELSQKAHLDWLRVGEMLSDDRPLMLAATDLAEMLEHRALQDVLAGIERRIQERMELARQQRDKRVRELMEAKDRE